MEADYNANWNAQDPNFDFTGVMDDLGVNAGNRIYRRCLKVDNVCPKEHVSTSFAISRQSSSSLDLPVEVEGWIEYNPLFPREIVDMSEEFMGEGFAAVTVEAGLAQSFGEDPAIYWVCLQIQFPTTGQKQFDDEYLNETLKYFRLSTNYFEFPG
jgi:hypothetical protein